MRKILFLDIDGVCNSKDTFRKDAKSHFPMDAYMTFLVGKIQLDTGCEIVLSSSWRHLPESVAYLETKFGKFAGLTGYCCTGIRGAEIYDWIAKNVPYEEREELRYAILDDSGDMLLWQKDHFFQTSFETGLTEEIAKKVTEHLNTPITE